DSLAQSVGVAEYAVGGFAADAGNRSQLFHGARNLSIVVGDYRLRHADQALRLVAEESRWTDYRLDICWLRFSEFVRRWPAAEEFRRDLVDPHVGALGGHDRRGGELVRVAEVELAVCVGIQLLQPRDDFQRA